jgi:hypothetical protein
MKREFKDKDDDLFLIDLLFDSDLSLTAIAKELGLSFPQLNKKINSLGLGWVKEKKKKSSRGQTALTAALQKLLPNQIIVNEHHIGERLRLDVYCPSYKIAAEFHGRQHFYYTKRFFDSRYDFEQAQKRDLRKIELCKENNIDLIVFRYNDDLSEQAVYDRLLHALRSSELVPQEEKKNKKSITHNKFYQDRKKQHNERKKEAYKKMKSRRDNHE